jgi:iron(III) transport system permease protein
MKARRTLIKVLAASLIFAIGDVWICKTLWDAFRSYNERNTLKEVTLAARTVPDDEEYFEDWLYNLPSIIEGGKAMIFSIDEDENLYPAAADPEMQDIWDAQSESDEFLDAMDSVYYLVPYKAHGYTKIDGVSMRQFFLPIPDETESEITGAVFMAVPNDTAEIERLILILGIGAWIVFSIILGIALLARDPITGYSVLFLFGISAIFIAYPLFESFRLTFIEGGLFTLDIWKQAFAPQYLRSLWGSVRLGILTATVASLIGYAFAFLTERTGVRGKRFISTMATLPVISPPFSLTLSLILLFGNNGLISNRLLHLQNFTIYGLKGLVLVQTIGMFPIAYMTLSSVLKSIDSTIEDAALDLRASRLRTFLTVTLPLSLPGILSAWLLVFTNSLADFANPLLLAGSYHVLSVDAYIEVTGRNNLGSGAALSLRLIILTYRVERVKGL